MIAHPSSLHGIDSRRRWFIAALLLFFVALSVQYSFKVTDGDGTRSAIMRWREQLLSLEDGENIYQRYVYPNPPIMALILLPIAKWPDLLNVPPLLGALSWFYLKVAMTLLALCWIFRIIETPERPFPVWAKVLTVLLSLRPIAGDLSHGNVNLFIMFLVVAGVYAFHRKRDFLGGVILALAMACKVTPALFIPYLIWKRATRALVGCAVGLALFFWPGFVPAYILGWEENQQHLSSWMKQMVKPYLIDGVVNSEHNNQSLPGLVYRMTTHSPSFVTYIDNQYTPVQWHNFLSWSTDSARWLVKGFMALFVLLTVWTCRTAWREQGKTASAAENNPRFAAEYSVVILGMLLFSERTWKHHCVTLVLPFAVLSYYLARDWTNRWRRVSLIGTLTMVVLLMSTTSTSLLGKQAGKLAQVYGVYVLAYLVLLLVLSVLLRLPRKETGPAQPNALPASRAA